MIFFSIDDRAMNPHFGSHSLSLDKHTEVSINLPVFKEGRFY